MYKIEDKIRDVFILKVTGNYVVIIFILFFVLTGLMVYIKFSDITLFIVAFVLFTITFMIFPVKIIFYRQGFTFVYFLGYREKYGWKDFNKVTQTGDLLYSRFILFWVRRRIFILEYLGDHEISQLKDKIKYYRSEKSY